MGGRHCNALLPSFVREIDRKERRSMQFLRRNAFSTCIGRLQCRLCGCIPLVCGAEKVLLTWLFGVQVTLYCCLEDICFDSGQDMQSTFEVLVFSQAKVGFIFWKHVASVYPCKAHKSAISNFCSIIFKAIFFIFLLCWCFFHQF